MVWLIQMDASRTVGRLLPCGISASWSYAKTAVYACWAEGWATACSGGQLRAIDYTAPSFSQTRPSAPAAKRSRLGNTSCSIACNTLCHSEPSPIASSARPRRWLCSSATGRPSRPRYATWTAAYVLTPFAVCLLTHLSPASPFWPPQQTWQSRGWHSREPFPKLDHGQKLSLHIFHCPAPASIFSPVNVSITPSLLPSLCTHFIN